MDRALTCPNCSHVLVPKGISAHGITRRQMDVLAFIVRFIAGNGKSPSYTEMAEGLGVGQRSQVHKRVKTMKARGLLTFSHLPRSIAVTPLGLEVYAAASPAGESANA